MSMALTVGLALGACDTRDRAESDAAVAGAPDGSPPDAAPPDAASAPDAPPDADPPAPDAAPPDADPCAACTAASECHLPTCTAGVCGEAPVGDGTLCGAGDGTTICVEGGCVTRGCGDGYREPGPVPAREGCDDGNVADGDGCSASCTPTQLVAAARPGESDEPTGAPATAIGVDGAGRVLMVWKADDTPTYEIHARRATRGGVPLDSVDASIVIDSGLWAGRESSPTVVGLDDGWVVAWSSITVDGDSDGIALRRVAPDGGLGPIAAANEEAFDQQHLPSLARLAEGFVVAWTDEGGPAGSRVRARRFDAAGVPLGGEIAVSPPWDRHEAAVVAAGPEGFLIAWAGWDEQLIYGRRFASDGTPADWMAFEISARDADGMAMWSFGPAAAVLESGDYVVGWTVRAPDFRGDVAVRVVAAVGDPVVAPVVAVATEAGVAEQAPSVAPLTGGGFVVLYHRASFAEVMDDIFLAPVDGVLAPEATEAQVLLAAPGIDQYNGSVTRADSGLWLAWGIEPGAAGGLRSFAAYLLPLE